MSTINVISSESYVRANSRFIKLTNLTIATYTELLFTILDAVSKKKTFDQETGIFKIDRNYVLERTGISREDQLLADIALYKLGIITSIDPVNKDKISVNAKRYLEILTDDSAIPEDLLPKTAKMSAADRSAAKRGGIVKLYVNLFNRTDEAANAALYRLVDTYYSKGYVRKAQWEPLVTLINAAAQDTEALVDLVDYMLVTGWQSIGNMIAEFMKTKKPTGTRLNTVQPVCSGTMKDVEF